VAGGVIEDAGHRRRFGMAYLLLACCVIAAAAVFGHELQSSPASSVQSVPWSNWAPSLPGVYAVPAIADHVGGLYHLPDGQQLSRVAGGYPGAAGQVDPSAPDTIRIPVSTIAVAVTDSSGQTTYTEIPTYPSTIEYQLCGTDSKCAIPRSQGGSSATVQAALRREAVELALYTFHYAPDISQVVELLPPDAPGGQRRALLLQRSLLSPSLHEPLAVTLPARVDAPHQRLIDTIASPLLAYSYQQQFDGTYQMVLSLPH
jgi:hypothetical protein